MAKIDKIICPLMGGNPCIEDGTPQLDGSGKSINVACRFWVHVQGRDPQTNQDINRGDCAFAWTPVLMIENSKVNRETGAAVESFRNETVKRTDTTNILLAGVLGATGAISGPVVPAEVLVEAASGSAMKFLENKP